MDALTAELLHHFAALPIHKRTALLELIRTEAAPKEALSSEESRAAWKEELSNTSVWTDEDVEPIRQAHTWINQWMPESF